jgi:hypothetical protein
MPQMLPPQPPREDASDADRDGYVHVYPLFDGREHVCCGFTCWCDPQPDWDNPRVVIHNPLN